MRVNHHQMVQNQNQKHHHKKKAFRKVRTIEMII